MWEAKAKGHKIGRPTIETTNPEKIEKAKRLIKRGLTTRRACLDAELSDIRLGITI